MIRKQVSILVLVVAGTTVACGDSGSPATPTPTQPPTTAAPPPPPAPMTRADAVIALSGSFECLDPFCDFADFELTLTNTGGVGANLNFVRVENRNGQHILELGADHFINAFGHNRLKAGDTMEFLLTAQLGFVVVVGYRDDNGNRGEAKYFPDLPR